MSIRFSAEDLATLTRVTRHLLSPLDFPTVDGWRAAIIRELRVLLRADSAGFLLPVTEGLALYSEEHDPAALALFPELTPPGLSDGTPIWARAIELGVTTLREGYGEEYDSYLKSAYHNEFVTPNRAFDTLSASFALGAAGPKSAASLQFWHSHPTRRCFGLREVMLLRHLRPAFIAGVQAELALRSGCADLLEMLDSLRQPALVGDISGKVVHQTPALGSILDVEPDRDRLRSALLDLLSRAGALARGSDLRGSVGDLRALDARVGRYHARVCFYGRSNLSSRTLVIITLESMIPPMIRVEDLRERFGLTLAQVRVAILIARGKPNVEIARELFISPHTAKRHTEHVMQKLGAKARAEVASLVMGATGSDGSDR